MLIDRVLADLARARDEVVKLTASLESARARVTKLEHYLEVARGYGDDKEPTALDPPRVGRLTLVQASIDVIRERGRRQPIRLLIEELERRGHRIGGVNKVTNLSSALSRSPVLSASRAEGWGLREWGSKDGHSADESDRIPESELPY